MHLLSDKGRANKVPRMLAIPIGHSISGALSFVSEIEIELVIKVRFPFARWRGTLGTLAIEIIGDFDCFIRFGHYQHWASLSADMVFI